MKLFCGVAGFDHRGGGGGGVFSAGELQGLPDVAVFFKFSVFGGVGLVP